MQSEYFLLFAHCIVASSICTYGGLDFCENICIAMCEINFYINAPKYEMRECWLVVVASTFKFCRVENWSKDWHHKKCLGFKRFYVAAGFQRHK